MKACLSKTFLQAAAAIAAIAAIAASPAAAVAQTNLLQNPGFEASKFAIAPWTFSGFAENIAVEDFATNGSVVSNAYAATCVGGARHSIEQAIVLKKGETYVVRYDVDATRLANWNYVDISFQVRSGTTWTDVVTPLRIIASSALLTTRQYAARFTLAQDIDAVRLTVFVNGTATSSKYRVHFDDIVLFEATETSLLYTTSQRSSSEWGKTNPTMVLNLMGSPGVAHVVFLGSGRLPTGVPVPDFTNLLHLDPAGLLVPMTTLVVQANGHATPASLTFPNAVVMSLVAVPLYYQPVAFNPLMNFRQFGEVTNLSYGK